ncbi:MAG: YtxH domain-containing protein [Vicinamibacteria bacterium]|nr:YtxH domain-containing protein [Vicinamibacteria bacterium]
MSDDQRNNAGGILLSFIVGALSGAALAVLFAPRSGRETREFLGEKIREGVDRGRDYKEKAVSKSRELVQDAGEFVDKQKETIKDGRDRLAAAVEAGRQAFKTERGKQG